MVVGGSLDPDARTKSVAANKGVGRQLSAKTQSPERQEQDVPFPIPCLKGDSEGQGREKGQGEESCERGR